MRIAGIFILVVAMLALPALAEVDLSSPRASAKSILEAIAKKDSASIKSSLLFEGSATEELGDVFIEMILAAKQLADATAARFSESGQPLARGMLTAKDIEEIEKTPIQENGQNEATLTIPGQPRPMRFVKGDDAKWRWAFVDSSGVKAEDLQNQLAILKSAATALAETAAEVESGKMQTVEEVDQALQQRLHQVLLESLRNNPPATQPQR